MSEFAVHAVISVDPVKEESIEITNEFDDIRGALAGIWQVVEAHPGFLAITLVHATDLPSMMDGRVVEHLGTGPIDGPREDPVPPDVVDR